MANTTADKLNGILTSKEAIRQAIIAKGQECPATTTLAQYASKISAISGGTGDYYKCASVDTTNQTWTGYKAVLSNGIYTFESTVTTGLTYTSVTPSVYSIYSADALVAVKSIYGGLPTTNLIYTNLNATIGANAETGQTQTELGSGLSREVTNSIPKIVTNGTGGLSIPVNESLAECTVSCWFTINENADRGCLLSVGGSGSGEARTIWLESYGIMMAYIGSTSGYAFCQSGSIVANTQYHALFTLTATEIVCYFNGILTTTIQRTGTPASKIYIGGGEGGLSIPDAKIYGIRVYNRALTTSEITELASEFPPATT